MKTLPFKAAKLFIAINTVLLTTVVTYAADNTEVSDHTDYTIVNSNLPITTLPTIKVYAEADGYIADYSSSATGLALKFKENPKSVTVITEDFIENQQLDTVEDIVFAAAGINTLVLDANRTEFYARGFEINDFNVDGMPVKYTTRAGEGAHLSSTAIYDKVEVVKGANGLMTGSGNPSATINVTRKHVDSTDFSGEVSATYDRFDTYGATVDVGSKLNQSGSIRGRAIIDYTAGDTFIDREDRSNKTAYGVVDIDFTDNTTVSIGAMHQEKIQDDVMWGALPIFYTDGSIIDWDINQSTSVDWQKREGVTDEVFTSLEHYFSDDWKLDFNANWAETKGDMELFYIYGYIHKPDDLLIDDINPITGLPVAAEPTTLDYDTSAKDTNISAKLSGNFNLLDRRHQVMVGTDYSNTEEVATGRRGVDLPPVIGLVNNWDGSYPKPTWGDEFVGRDLETTETALYGSVRLQLAEPLALILGSRVSNYEREGYGYGSNLDQKHDSEWTPFVGLTYDINNNSTVFASFTDIFSPQTERDVKGDYLDPIKGENIEFGIKGTNDEGTLQAQFSIFQINQDNLAQEDVGNFVTGTDKMEEAYYAVEGATSQGIDVEVSGKLSDNWQASLGYTHFNVEDADGNTIDTVNPNSSINFFTKYNMRNLVPGLTVGAGVNWTSERYVFIENPGKGFATQKFGQDALALVNVMANYEVNDNLDLQVNISNALDEEYLTSAFYTEQILFGEPLNVKGKITYKW